MGKLILRIAIGGALAVSVVAIFALLARGMDGHALIWGVITAGLIYEWGQI